jgi:hypothetical protein
MEYSKPEVPKLWITFFYKYNNFLQFKMIKIAKKKRSMILFWVVKIEIISKMGRTIRSLGTSALNTLRHARLTFVLSETHDLNNFKMFSGDVLPRK